MATITIRSAVEGDVQQLLALIHAGFEEYRAVLKPPSSAHRETLETIRQKLVTGGGFIACVDGRAAGCVLYEPEPDALYLGRLAVLSDFRKQGVAHALVDAVENHAHELHLPKVTLKVRIQLSANRAFFERLGYQIVAYNAHEGYSEPTFMTLEKSLA
jgi:predicted N-acetyltransferase YhbS